MIDTVLKKIVGTLLAEKASVPTAVTQAYTYDALYACIREEDQKTLKRVRLCALCIAVYSPPPR